MDIIMDIFDRTAVVFGLQTALLSYIALISSSIILTILKPKSETNIVHSGRFCFENVPSKLSDFFVAIPYILFSLYVIDSISKCAGLLSILDIVFSIFQLLMILACVVAMEVTSKLLKSELAPGDRQQSRLAASIHVLVLLIFSKQAIPTNIIIGYLLVLIGRFIFYDTVFDTKNIVKLKQFVSQIPFFVILSAYTVYLLSCLQLQIDDHALPALVGLSISVALGYGIALKFWNETKPIIYRAKNW